MLSLASLATQTVLFDALALLLTKGFHLKHHAVVKLRVRACAAGLGLLGAPVVGQEAELHQCLVTVETRRQVPESEQRDKEPLAAVTILHRETETSG